MQKPIPRILQVQAAHASRTVVHGLTSSDYSTSIQLTQLNTIPNILNLTSTALNLLQS
jgi:hypothetical protein